MCENCECKTLNTVHWFDASCSVIPLNNSITLISPVQFLAGLHFCRWQYMRSSANFRTVFSESQDSELGPDFNAKWPFEVIQGHLQCESKKIPPEDLWHFFQNGWEFFNQILHTYYAFLFTLDYEFLFNYLQLWRSLSYYAWPPSAHHVRKMSTISQNAFSDIFPEQLGIFSPNFTCLLQVPIYAGLQIFIPIICNCLCHNNVTFNLLIP